jgi:hypothetical protein
MSDFPRTHLATEVVPDTSGAGRRWARLRPREIILVVADQCVAASPQIMFLHGVGFSIRSLLTRLPVSIFTGHTV